MRWLTGAALVFLIALPATGSLAAKPPPGQAPPGHGQGHGGGQAKPRPGATPDWLTASGTACARGSDDRQAVLAAVQAHPSPTARQTLLRILAGTVRAERRMLGDLSVLRPRGSNAARFTRAVALFRRRRAADARLVTRLSKRWNARLLERQLAKDRADNDRLAILWQQLGVASCAQYFAAL